MMLPPPKKTLIYTVFAHFMACVGQRHRISLIEITVSVFLRCCFADVLDALQWIDTVRTAQNTGGKHYSQGIS